MRRNLHLLVALLMGSTALSTVQAQAGALTAFLAGLSASVGASATTAAVASALGGASLAGFKVGSLIFGTALGRGLLSLGLSAAAQALGARQLDNPLAKQANYAEPVSPWTFSFGTVRVGGPYLIHHFNKASPRGRHAAVILAGHRIDGIDQWFLDHRPVARNTGTGQCTSYPYKPFGSPSDVWLWPHLGAPGQVADARMVSRIPQWTSAHDVAGLAYAHAEFRTVGAERSLKIYNTGNAIGPVVAPAIRGALVYDPRTDSTGWSDNAALVIAAVLTRRGHAVDWAEVATEADAADELVPNRRGSLQRRWTLDGSLNDTDDLGTILAAFTAATDAYFYERADGVIGVQLGRWEPPAVTLGDDDFYALAVSENERNPGDATEFAAVYTEPLDFWTPAPLGPFVIDADAPPNRESVPLDLVSTPNQAARILKRLARVRRPRYRVRAEVGLIGYELLRTSAHPHGPAARTVRIEAHGFAFDAEVLRITQGEDASRIVFEAHSVTEDDWAVNPATEEPPEQRREQQAAREDDTRISRPATVTGAPGSAGQIVWTVTAPPGGVQFGDGIGAPLTVGTLQLRWRPVGGLVWTQTSVSVAVNSTSDTVTVSSLPAGTYEAQARYVDVLERPSQWTPSSAAMAG